MTFFLPSFDRTLVVAAISGGLLALAFPRPDFFPLAWIALVPLFAVMMRRPFASGFVAGLSFFSIVLYWLNIVMTTYGGLAPLFSLLAYLFLVCYLAVFFALSTWLASRLKQRRNIPILISLPCAWVALEYLRGVLLSGFPWALLGYSQQNFSAAIQSADVTGVYGVSFLLVAVNCALAWVITEPGKRMSWLGCAFVAMLTVSHVGYGVWRETYPLDQRSQEINVAVVQGNIDQQLKWDPQNRQSTVDTYRLLSEQALESPVDLLIWPEAATPFFIQEATPIAEQVKSLPMQFETPILLGSPAYQLMGDGHYRYFNSAFLLSDDSRDSQRSDKIHLVPFGEYVPLSWLLTFVDKLVVGVGDFSPGEVQPLVLNGDPLGVLICYEVIFPQLARDYVRRGSRLLVNLTNDAWFGRSSAPYQHLAMARFRSIENRIWMARSANTGISGFISPSGELTAVSPLFETYTLRGTIGLGAENTFYTKFGDLFAYLCLAWTAVLSVFLLRSYNIRRP